MGRIKRVLDVDVQIRLDKTKTQLGLEMVEEKAPLLDSMKLFCCSPVLLDDDDLRTILSRVFQPSENSKTLEGDIRVRG